MRVNIQKIIPELSPDIEPRNYAKRNYLRGEFMEASAR